MPGGVVRRGCGTEGSGDLGQRTNRARRRRPRPALSDRHRSVPAADQGRRGAPGPGHRGRPGVRDRGGQGTQGSDHGTQARAAPVRHGGRAGPADLRAVEPAAGRVDRQEVSSLGLAPARPDPGGEPRPDARRREVRLAQGLQVLDLRHVVDPPGHHPRHRQHRSDHPAARPRRRHAGAGAEGAGAVSS